MFWVIVLVRVRMALPAAVLEIMFLLMLLDLMGWIVLIPFMNMRLYPLQSDVKRERFFFFCFVL